MDTPLSAAEIKTLQSPGTEQVKAILPLLLKELVLNRWVVVHKAARPTNPIMWVLLGAFSLGLMALNLFFGVFVLMIILVLYYASVQPKTLISLTPLGEQILKKPGASSPLIVRILYTVSMARPVDEENCTMKEWREYLGKEYADNAAFHNKCLLFHLENRGLVKCYGPTSPHRTPAGDAVLAKIEADLVQGQALPGLLREGSSKAAAMAASLGPLVLLLPEMEGYYYDLFQSVEPSERGLEQRKNQTEGIGDSGGSGSIDSDEPANQEEGQDSDNGMDWGGSADFLDSSTGDDGGDSGIGTDSGCGVGADSSDGGGDGGDGGGDGGCSGCGGCGGGGD